MKKYLFLLIFGISQPLFAEQASHTAAQQEAKVLLDRAILSYQKQDYASALQQFQLADKAGHFKAARYLGLIYLNGEGVAKGPIQAVHFFEKSANQGDLTSQYWLGYLYENGIGVNQDWKKAADYYKLSAVRGLTDECAKEAHCNPAVSAPAMLALAQLNEKQGNLPKAIEYYQRAQTMNDEEIAKAAQTALARLAVIK